MWFKYFDRITKIETSIHWSWEVYTHCLRIIRQINCKRSLNFREQKITVCIHAWNRTLLQGFRISKSLKMINIFLKLFTGCLKNYPIMKFFIKYHLIPYSSSNFWFNFFFKVFQINQSCTLSDLILLSDPSCG